MWCRSPSLSAPSPAGALTPCWPSGRTATAASASPCTNEWRRLRMDRRQRDGDGQLSFLAPEDAALLQLVRENLRLLAELRVGYRSASRGGQDGHQARSPQSIADLLAPEMAPLLQEQLRVVLLDRRNWVLDVVMVYQGNVGSAVVRMAELFRDAVVANAPAVVLVHNHPSGDPQPSDDD